MHRVDRFTPPLDAKSLCDDDILRPSARNGDALSFGDGSLERVVLRVIQLRQRQSSIVAVKPASSTTTG